MSKSTPFNYQWRKNKIAQETQGEQADSWNFGEMSVVFGFIFKGKRFSVKFCNTITFLKTYTCKNLYNADVKLTLYFIHELPFVF